MLILTLIFDMQAKENWLLLPGIVSAFILHTVLKKGGSEGFNVTTKDIKEESKQTKLVAATENNVNANSTNVETQTAITAPKKGSGCGGGCSGECGNMVKAA